MVPALIGRVLACACIVLVAGCLTKKQDVPMEDIKQLIATARPQLKLKFGAATWEFVRIDPGEFKFGSPAEEQGREEGEIPQRQAQVTHAFYLGKYPVTQLQWRSIMGSNPSEVEGDSLAVDQITYEAALQFCAKLSTAMAVNITLPTEAQWEYACRAGTTTRFYSGDSEADLARAAWYSANSESKVHPVGQKEPNAWGLYDMLGNLYEPTIDYITSFDKLPLRDPEGGRLKDMGAMRGGFYMDPAGRCRSAFRSRTSSRFGGMGVRLAVLP